MPWSANCCCVPFCSQTRSKKGPDISFHEFPSNLDLRIAWIRAISRIDPETNNYWMPNDSSVVCSRHFTPDQFKTVRSGYNDSVRVKLKLLLPKSVPCVFPEYPEYLLGNFTDCQRFPSVLSKNAPIFSRDASSVVKVIPDKNSNVSINKECNEMKQTSSSKSSEKHPSVVASDEDNDVSSAEVDMECDGIEPLQASRLLSYPVDIDNASLGDGSLQKKSGSINNDLSTQKFPPSLQNVSPFADNCGSNIVTYSRSIQNVSSSAENSGSNVITYSHMYPSIRKPDRLIFCEKTDQKVRKELNTKLSTAKRDIHIKNAKILKLQENAKKVQATYKQLKTKLSSAKRDIRRKNAKILKLQENTKAMQALTEKIRDYNIDKLEESILSNDAKTLFIIDQLCSLRKKNILWSTSTMEFATHFEKKFPEAYDFLRRTNIISLPSTKILRFNQIENDDVGSDSVST